MALLYESDDSQFTARDQAPFDGSGAFSLAVRFATTSATGGAMVFVGRLEAGNIYATIRTDDAGKVIAQFRGAANVNLASVGTFKDGAWYTAVITWDGTDQLNLYVGSESLNRSLANSFPGLLNRVATGGLQDSSPSDFYRGYLEQFRAWTRELTAQEAADTIAGNPPAAANAWLLNDFSPHQDSIGTLHMTAGGTASVPQLHATVPPAWQIAASVGPTVAPNAAVGDFNYSPVQTPPAVITKASSPFQILSGNIIHYDPTDDIEFLTPPNPADHHWFTLKNYRSLSVKGNVTLTTGGVPIEMVGGVDTPVLMPNGFTFTAPPRASYHYAYQAGLGWMLQYPVSAANVLYRVTTVKTAANDDELVVVGDLVELNSEGAGFTLRMPSMNLWGGVITFSMVKGWNEVVLQPATGQQIQDPGDPGLLSEARLLGEGTAYEYAFNPLTKTWRLIGSVANPAATIVRSALAWYDVQSPVNVRNASGGQASIGQTVAELQDVNALNNHLTQGTDSLRPVLVDAGNQIRALSFDGIDDYMQRTPFAVAQPFQVISVQRFTSVTNNTREYIWGGQNLPGAGKANNNRSEVDPGTSRLTGNFLPATAFVLDATIDDIISEIRIQNRSEGVGGAGTTALPSLTVGGAGSASNLMNGQLMELALFAPPLNLAQAQEVTRYFMQKYASLM